MPTELPFDLTPELAPLSWLIGSWDVRDLRVASAGRVRLAVLGACAAEAPTLERTAARIHDVTDLAPAFARIPGSFHLLASVDGTTYLQGTHGTTIDVWLAATRRWSCIRQKQGRGKWEEWSFAGPLPPARGCWDEGIHRRR